MTIKEMKSQLKVWAEALRAERKTFRQQQRARSLWINAHPEYWTARWDSEIRKEYNKLPLSWGKTSALDYRYLHVVYCLARGRKYEQIEPKVREGNELNWARVEKMLAGVVRESEALRPGA